MSKRIERRNSDTVSQTPLGPIPMSRRESGISRLYGVEGSDRENISAITNDILLSGKISWRNGNTIKQEKSF